MKTVEWGTPIIDSVHFFSCHMSRRARACFYTCAYIVEFFLHIIFCEKKNSILEAMSLWSIKDLDQSNGSIRIYCVRMTSF